MFSTQLFYGHLVLLPFLCNSSGAQLPLRANFAVFDTAMCAGNTEHESSGSPHTRTLLLQPFHAEESQRRPEHTDTFTIFSMDKYNTKIYQLYDVAIYHLVVSLKVCLL